MSFTEYLTLGPFVGSMVLGKNISYLAAMKVGDDFWKAVKNLESRIGPTKIPISRVVEAFEPAEEYHIGLRY